MPSASERHDIWLPRGQDRYREAIRKLAQLDPVWLAVLFCYCAVFGGILVYSGFLPYTFDNNESFSAFWHARNMYEYGIANSSGLADESFSYDAAAHPYVYTHAGASPRLFVYLLYVLSIRTIELQIAVTVFTVGLLAFWFAYRFLAEISTRLYGVAACLVLMTDYIMFAQWHVGAWHVWKMFLLFGGLYLAQRVAARKQTYPLLMVYAFHAFLFYYETIFNVYVAAAVFLYFLFVIRDYRFALRFGLAQFAGALTAAAVLLGQLVLQFGWDVVRTDIYYAFIGRNFATDPAAFLEAAKKFYADHNIVFWLNVPDSSPFRNLLWALRVLFLDHTVHTPPWSLVVLAFGTAEVVRRLRTRRAPSSTLPRAGKLAIVSTTFVLGALSAAVFCILVRHPEIGAGLAPLSPLSISQSWVIVMGGIILAGVVVFRRLLHGRALPKLNKFFASPDWKQMVNGEALFALVLLLTLSAAIFHFLSRHPELAAGLAALSLILFTGAVVFAPPKLIAPPGRMLGASAFVAAVLAFLLVQHSLYAGMGSLEPIWRSAVADFADYTTGGALFISVMVLLAAWYACGAIDADRRKLPDQLLPVFVALLLAYLFVFFVFTGYILMGYFARYLPLTVFVNDLLLALGLVAIINCTCSWFAAFKRSIGWPRIVHGSAATVAGIGLASVVLYWSNLQAFLFRKLPPDEVSFFSVLSAPPFRGSTFAASIYGGTLAYFSKNWAYFDTNSALAEGNVILEPDGYRVKRDDSYVWFADRAVNVAYSKPEYFLAMTFQYHGLAQGRGLGHLSDDKDARRPRVGDVPLIRAIRKGQTSYLHPVEVARDPSPLDRWSIVRLDWDFPPFLRPLQASEFVALDVSSTENGTRIRIDYRYAHQEGMPEAGTRITLFAQLRCASPDQNVTVSPVVVGGQEFILPASFAGTVRAEVQPATATKFGPIYGSSPLQIGSVVSCPESSAVSK